MWWKLSRWCKATLGRMENRVVMQQLPPCQPEHVRIILKSDAILSYNWQSASKVEVHDLSPTKKKKKSAIIQLCWQKKISRKNKKYYYRVRLKSNSVGLVGIAQETATHVHQYWHILKSCPEAFFILSGWMLVKNQCTSIHVPLAVIIHIYWSVLIFYFFKNTSCCQKFL